MTEKVENQIILKNKKEKLMFNEKEHEYLLGTTKLNSVTTFLGKVFPFDVKKAARKVAEKHWISEEEVLQNWKEITLRGSFIHHLIEEHCQGKEISDDEKEFIQGALLFFSENPQYKIVGIETRLFSKEYLLGGTADLILQDIETGKLILADWKTSIKPINEKDIFGYALNPISHIPNNKYYKYSMQMAIYQVILKKTYNIDIFETILIHIINQDYKIISGKNLEWEAKELLKINLG